MDTGGHVPAAARERLEEYTRFAARAYWRAEQSARDTGRHGTRADAARRYAEEATARALRLCHSQRELPARD